MMRPAFYVVPFVLALASCGKHPLHGGWREEGAKAPRVLEFDSGSNRLMVHTAPGADGSHDHMHGSYRLEGTAIHVEWQEGSAQLAYDGSLDGDRIQVADKAGTGLVFVRGAAAH